MFDSIQTDLNSRLLTSNKATTSEAQAGTNDTKYVTPLKVQQKLNSLITTGSYSAGTNTVVNFANYANAKIITITGNVIGSSGSSNTSYIAINGTSISGYYFDGEVSSISSTSQLKLMLANSNLRSHSFELKFDLYSKTFFGNYYDNSSSVTFLQGNFNAVTTLQITLYNSATSNVTIQANA